MNTLRFLKNTSSALYIISAGMILIGFIGIMAGSTNPVLLGVFRLATFLSIAAFIVDCCVYVIEIKLLKKTESAFRNCLMTNADREEEAFIQKSLEAMRRECEEDEEAFIQKGLESIRCERKEKY